jgi:lipid II:glycine glycyltransferase (peptidoglycan interpeptide bridge formation enzyme)
MRIIDIDPITDSRWDEFVKAHPASTIFHTSSWAKVLRERYNREPAYLAMEDERGKLRAVAPFFIYRSLLVRRRLSCLPGSEYCFPLANSGADVTELVKTAQKKVASGDVSSLEIKGWQDSVLPQELGLKEYSYYLSHVVNLSHNVEELRASLGGKKGYHVRRNLKMAEESGMHVREARGEDDLSDFHRLTVFTRKRHNLFPEPYHFLQTIYKYIVLPGYGFLLLAELGDRIIAGSMYFCFGNTVLLKFNASDIKYSSYRPNYLLTWEAMERACQEGYERFDFGRSHPENHGLIRFKKQWGSQETLMRYYYYPDVGGTSAVKQTSLYYRVYTKANQLMPLFVAKRVGRVLYKYLG